jgi:tRNA (guanine37-N1)-methyltransferase
VFEGLKVPEVLLSGHHQKIREWRKENSYQKTKNKEKMSKNNNKIIPSSNKRKSGK